MSLLDLVTFALLLTGLFFFVAGTLGLIRFPDLYCRLHALTKADNVGLGFTILAFMLQAGSWREVFKLGLIWVMILVATSSVCFLIANEARRRGRAPWRRRASS